MIDNQHPNALFPFSRHEITLQRHLLKCIPNPQTIGELIKNRRIELKMTQKQLADYFGVYEDTVAKWELGIKKPHKKFEEIIRQFLA